MATPPGRVAFQRCLVHEHRNPNSAISALALDAAGTKLYLGFTDGQLEEYKITISFAQAKALLSARKHVGKKVYFPEWWWWDIAVGVFSGELLTMQGRLTVDCCCV